MICLLSSPSQCKRKVWEQVRGSRYWQDLCCKNLRGSLNVFNRKKLEFMPGKVYNLISDEMEYKFVPFTHRCVLFVLPTHLKNILPSFTKTRKHWENKECFQTITSIWHPSITWSSVSKQKVFLGSLCCNGSCETSLPRY